MAKREPRAKWIVKKIAVQDYGEIVPLRVDVSDPTGPAVYWFEFPEGSGNQYAGHVRSVMVTGIKKVVADHYADNWTQHIAVEERKAWSRGEKSPPYVGFEKLYRFERSIVKLRVPNIYDRWVERRVIDDIQDARKNPDVEYKWRMVTNTEYRLFPGDTEPLYNTDRPEDRTLNPYRDCLVFDYTEELWQRFVAIHDACVQMHGKLRALMEGTPDDVSQRLMAAMPSLTMLPAPEEDQ